MKNLKSIDHVGYAVHDIMETAKYYLNAGWELSEVYEEKNQNARIAFLYKDGFTTIELVAPLEGKKHISPHIQRELHDVSCQQYLYNVSSYQVAQRHDTPFSPFAPCHHSRHR